METYFAPLANGFTPPEPMPPTPRPEWATCQDDEYTARVDWLVDEINRAIAREITDKPLFFVPGTPTAQTLVRDQLLEYSDLGNQMAQLLIDVAAGHRMQGHASELLRVVVERFAQGVTK